MFYWLDQCFKKESFQLRYFNGAPPKVQDLIFCLHLKGLPAVLQTLLYFISRRWSQLLLWDTFSGRFHSSCMAFSWSYTCILTHAALRPFTASKCCIFLFFPKKVFCRVSPLCSVSSICHRLLACFTSPSCIFSGQPLYWARSSICRYSLMVILYDALSRIWFPW